MGARAARGEASRPALKVERVRSPEVLEALGPEWEEIDRAQWPRTPFTSPAWNLLWWRHYEERRFAVRDEFCAHVVRGADGRLIAVAPLVLTRRPGVGARAVRTLHFFGSDHNVTEIRGLVCRPGEEKEALGALLDHFLSRPRQWDWFHVHGLPGEDASIWRDLPGGPSIRDDRMVPDYYLELPDSWEALRARLGRNVKESLRKCYNSLRRDGHAFVFRVRQDPRDVREAIDRFLVLHAARARFATGSRHGDVFNSERSQWFLHDYGARLAEAGALRVFQLEIGGRVVATRVGFLAGDHLYLYFSGFEESWGRYSVMTTVLAEAIKWSIENGVRVVNLSTGSDVSKLRWSPRSASFRDGVLVSPTARGALAYRAFTAAKEHAESGGTLGRLLRSLRRG